MTTFNTDLFQPQQKGMRVLVACEYSGVVRNAFLERGHDAWSCDLLPSEDGSNRHIRGDAREVLNDGWDLLMVALHTALQQRWCVGWPNRQCRP